MRTRLIYAEISISNFLYNLGNVKSLVGKNTDVMAVIKANAYGHGSIELAKAAEASGLNSMFGVACLYEAQVLRESGIKLPIMLLGYTDSESLETCVDLDLTLNIMDKKLMRHLNNIARKRGKIVPIHIKTDTGMHRLGLLPDEAIGLISRVGDYKNLSLEGVFTHFASSDDEDLSFAHQQLLEFKKVLGTMQKRGINFRYTHCANSAATLRMPESHFNLVRPGVILYGLAPYFGHMPFEPKPVMALKTQVVQIRKIKKGETVGYGRIYKASEPRVVAALPVGYADGFRRAPNNWGRVLIRGKFAPILGRVSMDQTSVDISDMPDVKVGDEVVLIGRQGRNVLSTEDVAEQLETINYEVTSSIASRVSREYV